ncbi:MAG TPA: penicillin-binding protein 2 [Candidatus Obscuribacterales bacterium]
MPTVTAEFGSRSRSRLACRKPRSPLWRLRIWQILIYLGFLLVIGRLYYLEIVEGPTLLKRAQVQRQQHNLLVHRGAITDRHGLPLAIDTTRYDVYVHPELLKAGPHEAAEILARITKQSAHKAYKLLTQGYPVITLARHLERETVDEIQALNWPGVDIVPIPFRHYPEGQLAAHILGYVNMDTKGQGGVEQAEEQLLKDTGSIPKPQLDGHGRTILLPHAGEADWGISPPLGRHVELTIDNYLQHLAEKELFAMARHSRALKGTALIADPTNGEILAWANYPPYDPNHYSKFPLEITKNWSMVDVYQPGSTFKIITVSSGLDTGAIKPNSTFYDGGAMRIGNRTIHNHDGGHGTLDLLHLFIHSSNIATAQVALAMSAEKFHSMLTSFGIGQPTGIDLPGESAGLLLHHKYWKPLDQATTGFGQGAIAVTPLQLVAAVSAVANDGVWIQPHLIRRVYDPRTGVTEKWTEPKKRQVISSQTAKLVSRLLADNIALGTQIAGKVPGYRVAGKTGTAQKVVNGGRGYIPGQTIASFIGFLPADNPQLICLVVLDSPQTDGRWGNTVAGPVFNAITMEAARYLGIPPTQPSEGRANSEKLAQASDPWKALHKSCAPLPEAPSTKYARELAEMRGAEGQTSNQPERSRE